MRIFQRRDAGTQSSEDAERTQSKNVSHFPQDTSDWENVKHFFTLRSPESIRLCASASQR